MAHFVCHPRPLADALTNAVILGNGTGTALKPNRNSCPYVYLVYQDSDDGDHGVVAVYGSGRYTAGRTLFHLDGQAPGACYIVSLEVAVAKELASKLRQSPIGADVTAAVTIYDQPEVEYTEDGDELLVDMAFHKQEECLAELANADAECEWEWTMDIVDKPLASLAQPVEGPLLLTVEDLKRLTSVASDAAAIDFIRTGYPGAIAFKLGTTVSGVIGEVDRNSYVAGGPHGTGNGKPEHLFTPVAPSPAA